MDAAENTQPVPHPKRSLRQRIGLATAATLIALVLCEMILRWLAPQNLSGSWRINQPTRGYKINKAGGTARHEFEGRLVHYRFNSHHLRGPEPGTAHQRVLCLGDSFTFGWLLHEEDTYVHCLNQKAAKTFGQGEVEFVNGGAGGWGTAHQLAFLEDYGDRLKPTMVLVFFNGDDIRRTIRSQLYTLSESGELRSHRMPIDPTKQIINRMPGYQFLLEHSHLIQLTRSAFVRHHNVNNGAIPPKHLGDTNLYAEDLKLSQRLFQRLHQWCLDRNVSLAVTTTGYEHVDFVVKRSPRTQAFLKQAKDFFARENIPYHPQGHRLAERVGGQYSSITIPKDGHPNEAGAQLIAELNWPWIARHLTDRMSAEATPPSTDHTKRLHATSTFNP